MLGAFCTINRYFEYLKTVGSERHSKRTSVCPRGLAYSYIICIYLTRWSEKAVTSKGGGGGGVSFGFVVFNSIWEHGLQHVLTFFEMFPKMSQKCEQFSYWPFCSIFWDCWHRRPSVRPVVVVRPLSVRPFVRPVVVVRPLTVRPSFKSALASHQHPRRNTKCF